MFSSIMLVNVILLNGKWVSGFEIIYTSRKWLSVELEGNNLPSITPLTDIITKLHKYLAADLCVYFLISQLRSSLIII